MNKKTHKKGSSKVKPDKGRRIKGRRAVKPGAYVVFKKSLLGGLFNSRVVHSAEIVNISITGIKAQYTATTTWSRNFDKMSIVTTDKKIKIDNIPCKVISDSMVAHLENGTFVRRCGIKLGELSDKRKKQFSTFVQEYVIDSETSKPWHIEFS
jgi:hypothetical protein